MRRRVLAFIPAAMGLVVSGVAVEPATAHPGHGLRACGYRARFRDIPCGEVDRALTESAAEFNIDGGRFRSIVRCESRFNPYADGGRYQGLFQQAPRYRAGSSGRVQPSS